MAVAAAYCRSRDFNTAASFRKVDRREVSGLDADASTACLGGACEALVAIECAR